MNREPRGVGVEEGGVGDGGEGPFDDGSPSAFPTYLLTYIVQFALSQIRQTLIALMCMVIHRSGVLPPRDMKEWCSNC